MNIPDPIQTQPPAPENRRSVDSGSISSGGSHSIPDEFYQAYIGSGSSGIGTDDEENSDGNTPGSSNVDLNVSCIEEPDDDPSDRRLSHPAKPREHYQKHTGRFADAAPRAALSNIEQEYLDPRKAQTNELDVDESKTVIIASRSGSSSLSLGYSVITERDQEGKLRHVVTGIVPDTKTIRVVTERTEIGEEILAPVNAPEGEEREIVTELDTHGKIRYIIRRYRAATISSSTRITAKRTSTGEIRYVIVGDFSGNAIRVITRSTPSGVLRMTPTNKENGELRRVTTEHTESGAVRYVVGDIIGQKTTPARINTVPRIVREPTSTGEIRYVIIDQYNDSAIRTMFERDEITGEYRHIPVMEPQGELRYVIEERTETGQIRKVIGSPITGNVTSTTEALQNRGETRWVSGLGGQHAQFCVPTMVIEDD